MNIRNGSYIIGPQAGRLLVKTSRTGLGAKAGHDLTIEVTRWRGKVAVDATDLAACSVTLEAEVDSFEVREGTGGVKPLTDADRADIRNTLRTKVLDSARYPSIVFESGRVSGTPEAFRIDGELTIVGVTQLITVEGGVRGDRVQGSAVVAQTRWGIKPYSAFLGALRLQDEVEVQFDIGLSARP